MYTIFYSPLYEKYSNQEEETYSSTDPEQSAPETSSDETAFEDPPPSSDGVFQKFQKYILYIKLSEMRYKLKLIDYNQEENPEFRDLSKLLILVLDFFSLFNYDQIFELSNIIIEKFSKIKLKEGT